MPNNETAVAHLVALGCTPKVAATIVARCGADLSNLTISELRAAGAPESKATKIYGAIAAARSLALRAADAAPVVLATAENAWQLLAARIGSERREHFVIVALDVRNKVIGVETIAIGNLVGVEVHPREVFRAALRLGAAGIVLAHNHPSGDPTPSHEDVELTKRLKQCGDLLGVLVVDHVVVTDASFRSIAEWMGSAY